MKYLFTHLKEILVATFVCVLLCETQIAVVRGESHLHFGFHADGKTTTTFSSTSNDSANAVAFYQGDARFVVAGVTDNGGSSTNFCVMRYNSSGGLDTTFGTNGKLQTDFGGDETANAVKVQSDGKIVVAGTVIFSGAQLDVAVARYNSDGSLDTTFSGDGKLTIDFQGGIDRAHGLAIDVDGKIVIGGSVDNDSSWGLVRLNTNGTLDTTFSGDGKVITEMGGGAEYACDVIALSDGKIIAGGSVRLTPSSNSDFAIARYNPNGSLDATFSGDGKVITDFDGLHNGARAIKRDPAGRYVLVGESNGLALTQSYSTVARYTPGGSLDTSFNGVGWVQTDLNPANEETASDVSFNSLGRLTVAGRVLSNSPAIAHFVLLRFNENGSRDLNFGTGGRVNTLFGTGNGFANAIVINPGLIDPDLDNIYAVGTYYPTTGDTDFAVARYTAGGPANRSQFYGAGESSFAVFRPADGNWYVLNVTSGLYTIIHWGQAGDIPVPGDYDRDGMTDTAIFRGGVWYISKSSDGGVIITQFGLPDDKPVQGDYDGDGRCDIAVYRPSNGVWHLLRSTLGYTSTAFGLSDDKPAQDDFDGDGLTDLAVFRPSTGIWYIQSSTLGYYAAQFGTNGDRPVPGDYDADGKADIAVFRPSTGVWYTINSQSNTNLIAAFGISTDIPGPADFDGDGKSDLTVFRPSTGVWYSLRSSDGGATVVSWGASGDVSISAAYSPQ